MEREINFFTQEQWERIAKRFKLTKSERGVAELWLQGMDCTGVAGELGKTPGTVRNQTRSIYEKTGAKNRIELLWIFAEALGGLNIPMGEAAEEKS